MGGEGGDFHQAAGTLALGWGLLSRGPCLGTMLPALTGVKEFLENVLVFCHSLKWEHNQIDHPSQCPPLLGRTCPLGTLHFEQSRSLTFGSYSSLQEGCRRREKSLA